MKAIIILLIVAVCAGCSRVPPGQNKTYPSLAEQRASLSNKPYVTPVRILDSLQIVTDLRFLASDSCAGRGPGSPGHRLAEERILKRMRNTGLDSFGHSLLQLSTANEETRNLVGWIKGRKHPEKFLVISAHYDHLGKRNGKTFYGADDNASGVACLLALAKYYKQHTPDYSLVFAAFDREEGGLFGAKAFVQKFVAEQGKEKIILNLNLDMISRSDKNEIFASGISKYPSNRYLVDAVQSKVNVVVLMGHDTGNNQDDWTMQSDHAEFHKSGIPFLYIGVEDHPDYHKATDTFDKINLNRYIENCNMIALMINAYK
jgi:Zn-dependent M28 family amino/carboxypeptidase